MSDCYNVVRRAKNVVSRERRDRAPKSFWGCFTIDLEASNTHICQVIRDFVVLANSLRVRMLVNINRSATVIPWTG